MSGRAMSIGMAKPMPWLPVAPAVLMPMTLPLGSSSGPPLLPGLIAVSVWMRLVRVVAAVDRDAPAERRDDAARDRVGERAERAADGDGLLADLDRSSESPIGAVGRPVASILTMARSVSVSMP